MRTSFCFTLVLVAALGIARAQTSASYRLTGSTFNAGGDPANGLFAASTSYHVRLDAIGDAALGTGFASASYHADGGFVAGYPPPGEVKNLRWTSDDTMIWDPDRSVGRYSLYRGPIGTLPDGFGSCQQPSLPGETAVDAAIPPAGSAWFYLVTARNGLAEEGTKGYQSNGMERANPSACP